MQSQITMRDSRRSPRRSRINRQLGGVLAGIAYYFGLDPTRVRVGYAVLTILSVGFPGILIYIALYLVIPDEGE